jgi:hypothetical protein
LTLALSHEAHEGRRWSQRFLRSRQRLHALTLRNEEAADAVGAVGDVGFAEAMDDSEGDWRSASWEESSKERLMPLIRAHGRAPRDRASVGLGRLVVVGCACSSAHSRWAGPASCVPRTTLEMATSVNGQADTMRTVPNAKMDSLLWRASPYPKKHRNALPRGGLAARLSVSLIREIVCRSRGARCGIAFDVQPRGSGTAQYANSPLPSV